jgi:hypothetical protein
MALVKPGAFGTLIGDEMVNGMIVEHLGYFHISYA